MALTKVTGHVIKSDTNITSHNINSSGIITAISFDGNVSGVAVTFTGDSTIGSLGITTNLNVGGISTFTGNIDANGDIDVDGHTNLDNVSIAGVVTATDLTVEKTGNLNVNIKSTSGWGALEVGGSVAGYIDIKKPFSDDYDLRLMCDGTNNYIASNARPLKLDAQGANGIELGAYGAASLKYNNNTKLSITNTGAVVSGILTVTGNMNVEGVLTYQDVTNIDSIGIVTARSDIRGGRNLNVTGISTFAGTLNAANIVQVGTTNDTGELRIGHDGSSYRARLVSNSSNRLTIDADGPERIQMHGGVIYMRPLNTEKSAAFVANGAVELYYNDVKKFETGNTVNINSNHFEITSGQQLRFDNSNNNRTSEILNDGSSGNSVLTFKTNGGNRWTIDSSGHFLPGTAGAVNIGSASAEIGDVYIADDKRFYAGSDQNISLYHTSSNGINHLVGHPGNMFYHSTTHYFTDAAQSQIYAQFIYNSYCELRHSGNLKFRTSATGIDVTGEVAATQDYPNIQPTLDLNFAAVKKLDSRITFYRTTIGSYIDENGDYRWASANEPRFDHDEVTHESKGLLMEIARTNKLTSGNNIPSGGNSGGNPGPSLVANHVEAPDGSPTARTIDYSNASGNMNSANIEFSWDNSPAGKTYSASIWVKGTQGHTINMYLDASGQGSGNLNEAKIHRTLTGKWQRMSVYYTYPSGANAAYLRVGTRSLHGLTQGTATVVSFWGTTVVEESRPGSTIATPIVTVTTAPDYALIDGEEFSEFYSPLEHTTVMIGKRGAAINDGRLYTISDGTSSQVAPDWDFNDAEKLRLSTNVGGNSQMVQEILSWSGINDEFKIAAGMAVNNQIGVVNGTAIASADTSCLMPTGVDRLYFGLRGNGGNQGSLTIKRFMFYPKRLPDSQLVTLTS